MRKISPILLKFFCCSAGGILVGNGKRMDHNTFEARKQLALGSPFEKKCDVC